jgi:hypothetical protein
MLSLVLFLLWLMSYIGVLYGLIAYLTMLWHGPSVVREFVSDVEVEVTLRPTVSRPVRLVVLSLLERVTRCYIYLSDNYFLYFSCRAPSLTRGRVCNFQCNDASSISSYIASDGLSASSCRSHITTNSQSASSSWCLMSLCVLLVGGGGG